MKLKNTIHKNWSKKCFAYFSEMKLEEIDSLRPELS